MIEQRKDKGPQKSALAALIKLAPYFRLYRWYAVLIVFLSGLSAIFSAFGIAMVVPIFALLQGNNGSMSGWFSFIAAYGNWFAPSALVYGLVLLVMISIILKGISGYLLATVTGLVQKGLMRNLRMAVFDQYLSVGNTFIDSRDKGLIREDYFRQTKYTAVIFTALAEIVTSIIHIAALLVVMAVLSGFLMAITILGMIGGALVYYALMRTLRKLGDRLGQAGDDLSQHVLQIIDGLQTVKDFGRESRERERLSAMTELQERYDYRIHRTKAILPAASELLAATVLTGMILVANRFYDQPLPLVIAFAVVIIRMVPSINQLVGQLAVFQQNAYGAVKMWEILDRSDKPYLIDGQLTELPKGDIAFEALSFGYSQDSPLLTDVSFVIPAGKMTAVVGPSGTGKSTIIELLARFYDPQFGRITIVGTDVRQFKLAAWRSILGVVRQDTWIFNASIRANIAYGKLDASDEEIIEAARLAGAHDFTVRMPKGYSTLVGERGVKLSGGQRQRIAIARALVRRPRILVFDEATSSLDTASERVIQEAIDVLSEKYTILVIAHRLSTIVKAQSIVVLDDGRVVGMGAHEDLLARCNLYRRLWLLQLDNQSMKLADRRYQSQLQT